MLGYVFSLLLQVAIGFSFCLFGFAWYPCCSIVCHYATDNFNRANNADPNVGSSCGWTVDAGSAPINTNQMRITTANTIAKCNASGNAEKFIEAAVTATTVGDIYRFYFDYTNSGDWQALEIEVLPAGAFTYVDVRLIDDTLAYTNYGGKVVLDTTIANTFRVCIQNGELTVYVGGSVWASFTNVTASSGFAAIGTGGTVTGTVIFDSFELYDAADMACKDCSGDCTPCATGTTPTTVTLTVPAGTFTVGDATRCTGGNCTCLEGAFVLKRHPVRFPRCTYSTPGYDQFFTSGVTVAYPLSCCAGSETFYWLAQINGGGSPSWNVAATGNVGLSYDDNNAVWSGVPAASNCSDSPLSLTTTDTNSPPRGCNHDNTKTLTLTV